MRSYRIEDFAITAGVSAARQKVLLLVVFTPSPSSLPEAAALRLWLPRRRCRDATCLPLAAPRMRLRCCSVLAAVQRASPGPTADRSVVVAIGATDAGGGEDGEFHPPPAVPGGTHGRPCWPGRSLEEFGGCRGLLVHLGEAVGCSPSADNGIRVSAVRYGYI